MQDYPQKSNIRVATAPVSWGVMEETDTTVWPDASHVLQEIALAGYQGTELGPFGYYPTEALALQGAIEKHNLKLTSAFVPVQWFQPDRLSVDVVHDKNLSRHFVEKSRLNTHFILISN